MIKKTTSLLAQWQITLFDIVIIVVLSILTIGGIYISAQDIFQSEQTLNINLTQIVILNQRIVNLQREVLLTRNEVKHLLGDLEPPITSISRFVFAKILIDNLAREIELSTIRIIYSAEDIANAEAIVHHAGEIESLISQIETTNVPAERTEKLREIDGHLETMESVIKQLIDRQASTERDEIVRIRDSLRASQRNALLVGITLLLVSSTIIFIIRRTLRVRLQQAIEAERFKSHLLANASHELRTPINAIRGYTELMYEGSYGSLSNEQHTAIHRILLNTTQLQGMVNNLLDRAQIEQGKLTIRNDPLSPSELLNTTLLALNILAADKGIELRVEVAPEVPKQIVGDALRLQQITTNLISNAIKFTEKGFVQVQIFKPDDKHWGLKITDTGIGLSSADQSQVFDPFWQADSSATRMYRGSGLGLAIVKQLTDLMNGKITLTSALGVGSTFTVIFPLELTNE